MTKNLLYLTQLEVKPVDTIIADAPSLAESKDNNELNDDIDSVSSSESESSLGSYDSQGSELTEESFSSMNTKNKFSPIQISSIAE